MAKIAETPLMLQYPEMKKKHPDAILLFRVGDFYETFSDDAIAASEILGITLTRRPTGKHRAWSLRDFPTMPSTRICQSLSGLGGVWPSASSLKTQSLQKTRQKGNHGTRHAGSQQRHRGIAGEGEQFPRGYPRRQEIGRSSAARHLHGEFLCGEAAVDEADKMLSGFQPKELLRMKGTREFCSQHLSYRGSVFELDDWVYTTDAAEERLLKQFDTATLKGFGVEGMKAAVVAAGSILYYLDLTNHTEISHITSLSRIDNRRYMHLDRFTVRNRRWPTRCRPTGRACCKS